METGILVFENILDLNIKGWDVGTLKVLSYAT